MTYRRVYLYQAKWAKLTRAGRTRDCANLIRRRHRRQSTANPGRSGNAYLFTLGMASATGAVCLWRYHLLHSLAWFKDNDVPKMLMSIDGVHGEWHAENHDA